MIRISYFLILFVFSFVSECNGQNNPWQLKKDEDGIQVYVRTNDESSFDEFKAVTRLENCSWEDAASLLVDVANYENWFPDCSISKVLEHKYKYKKVYYIETEAPWPVANRCGIYEQTVELFDNQPKAELVFVADTTRSIELGDKVRITEALGKWTLEEKDGSLNVIYQFKGNPGGDIPAWIANAFVVKHPFETLTNLKKQLGK